MVKAMEDSNKEATIRRSTQISHSLVKAMKTEKLNKEAIEEENKEDKTNNAIVTNTENKVDKDKTNKEVITNKEDKNETNKDETNEDKTNKEVITNKEYEDKTKNK